MKNTLHICITSQHFNSGQLFLLANEKLTILGYICMHASSHDVSHSKSYLNQKVPRQKCVTFSRLLFYERTFTKMNVMRKSAICFKYIEQICP